MFANLLRRAPESEERALQVYPWGQWNGNPNPFDYGQNVSADTALQLLTVHGCVTLISDTIATLPRDVYKNVAGTPTEVANPPRWLEQPNPETDIVDFLTQSITSLLLDGNCYWSYGLDGNFMPTNITVLDPSKVTVRRDGNQQPEYIVDGKIFVGRLLHIRGIRRAGQLKGLSPIEAARQSISIGLNAQDFAGAFYKNGTVLSGVIQTPGQLTKEQARDLKQNFSTDHAGPSKAHQPGVLTNGATWQPLSVTPEQAQFLESRQFQANEICAQLFLLDPSMLGIAASGTRGSNLTYANLEQRGIHLVQFTLMRWIIRLERAFSSFLPKPQYMKFNVDAVQRADLLTRAQAYRTALGPTAPWMTVNEVRLLEDEPPLPGQSTIPTPAPPAPPFGGPPNEPQ